MCRELAEWEEQECGPGYCGMSAYEGGGGRERLRDTQEDSSEGRQEAAEVRTQQSGCQASVSCGGVW